MRFTTLIILVLGVFLTAVVDNTWATTVNVYQRMSQVQQEAFIAGVGEGLFFATYVLDKNHWYLKCYPKMEHLQMKAIFDKYIEDHPEIWDKESASLYVSAISNACEKRGDL